MEEQEEKVDEQALNLYQPLLNAPTPPRQVELMSIDQCEVAPELDDLQLVGVPVEVSAPADVAAGEGELAVDVEVHVSERSGGKRRRGRPPRFQAGAQARAPPKKKDEEDVCFICFDGGSLVLCDRRGCPKAYHPACIKRDEAFFRSKAKWNCGWHICGSCQKAAHYMCYTCTYSLCKACTKDADYLCVRSNKGFCGICMRTIMLIENNAPGNEEMVQVDFDDKGSWEYLFKVYWIYLKEKLSLTIDDLARAKNPWKGDVIMARKREHIGELYDGKDGKGFSSYGYLGDLEPNNSKRRKTNEQSNFLKKETLNIEKPSSDSGRTLPEGMGWASKELLEFVALVKSGDTSVMSQFDVQNLLLEYIKRNNLRDPCQKCQILCDTRLVNLFGKARVGHFEMLKLLEYHFLIKENPQTDSIIQEGVVDALSSQVGPHGNNDNQLMGNKKRSKTHKKHDERGPQINLDEYAAIDVHNINLIYLRRALMENLIDGTDKFHDKVVGSIVRIKISSSDQKQDMHRLVQVVGTSKVAEPYKIGNKTADIMLEILNLDKKEVISIDGISNHEFSEDECGRLRQSIKCGLIKQLTVGEIQGKAMALQPVRVNDWLETEVLRLNRLRDRASEHGHRKELRECVEKLQHLNSLEERQRRLLEIPEVHTDPNMDPKFGSEDFGESDDKEQDDKMGARGSDVVKDGRNRAQNPIDSVTGGSNNQAVVGSQLCSGAASETSLLPHFTGITPSANDDGNDNLWHYQDPSGKIQGPFSLVQLCKWSTSGHFPPDLRIWRINEKQNDSMLLTDALNGQQQKKPPLVYSNDLLSQEARVASDCRDNNWVGEWSGSMNASRMKNSKKEGSWNSTRNDANPQSNGNNDFVTSSGWDSCSSSLTAPADIINSSGGQCGSFVLGWDLSKINNSSSGQSQVSNSLPSCTLPEKPFEKLSNQGRECRKGEAGNAGQNNGDLNSPKASESQTTNSGQSYEKQCDSQDHAGQSSGQNWRHPPVNSSNSEFVSEGNPVETSLQNQEIDFPDLPSPTPKPGDEDSKDRAAENKQSASSNLPVQESGLSWSTASSLVGGGAHIAEVAGEWGAHSPAPEKPPVEEWDSNIMSATSLKVSEMASDHAATPTSGTDQLTHFPPAHLASNTSSWQAFAVGPDEFSTLDDESVSDLLAEYEAMETLAGLASPTSIMYCGGDFTQGSKNDCFSSVEDFSPVPEPGKSDALSSTGDLQIHSQSAVTDEPHGVLSNTNVFDPQKRSGGQSSTSLEVEADTKLSDVSVNQREAGSDIQPFAPSTTSLDLAATDTTWRAGSETTVTSGGPVYGNENFGWGGLAQGNPNMVWEAGKGMGQANANVSWSDAGGSPGIWGSQPKYGAERFFAPREHSFQGGDSDFGRGRSLWNRQSFSGGNGGSSPISPPPKGQRVCKYYENGYCKKGASCSYLHP